MLDPSKIPDLSNLKRQLKGTYLAGIFVPTSRSQKELLVERTLVRLIDKALNNYLAARETAVEQMKAVEEQDRRGGLDLPFLNFTDHIEDCIITLNRLFDLLDLIRGGKLTICEPVRQLIDVGAPPDSVRSDINTIRNAVEHIGGKILQGTIGQTIASSYIMLGVAATGEAICIGPWCITFAKIADVIRYFHGIGQETVSRAFSL